MTNEQIIAEIAASVYGEDTVMEMLEKGIEIPLHTAKGWATRAYRIKKNEHGLEARLWRKRKKNDTDDGKEDENNENMVCNDYYKAKAYLFRADQVERCEDLFHAPIDNRDPHL